MRALALILGLLLVISLVHAQETDLCTDVVCDDGDLCTQDSCDPATGCIFEPIACPEITETCPDGTIVSCTPICDPATGCGTCTPDCAGHELETLESYLAGLILSSEELSIADMVVSYANKCANLVGGTDYYAMAYECKKNAYYIKRELSKLAGLSESDWNEVADYIMIKSTGDPSYWYEDDKIKLNHGWKELIPQKLTMNIQRWEDYAGEMQIVASLDINWYYFDLTGEGQKLVDQAEQDYWKWEDEQRKLDLISRVDITVSGDSEILAKEILDVMNDMRIKAQNFDTNPSTDTAYALAYAQRLYDGKLRGFSDVYSYSVVERACDYAAVNGPGIPDVWEDEFGKIEIGGLTIYESATRKGFNVRFDCWYDEWELKTYMNLWTYWDRESLSVYKDSIDKGRLDAEEEARRLEMAAKLRQYLETFKITDDNKEIAKDLVDEINTFVADLRTFELSADAIYDAEYRSVLIRAKLEGVGDALDCDDLEQVATYIIIYTEGTANIWEDEFGEQQLDKWKELFKNDYLTLSINWWGCDEWSATGSMGLDIRWNKEIFSDHPEYADSVKNARDDAWREAEKLRKQKMLIKARKIYEFSLEEKEIGDYIIDKLKMIKEKVIGFEKSPSMEGAYDLHYNYILLTSELDGISMAHRKTAEKIGIYVMLNGPGIPDIWKDEYGDVEIGHTLRVYEGDKMMLHFNRWYDERQERGGFGIWLNWGILKREYKEKIKLAEREAWQEADNLRRQRLADKLRAELEPEVEAGVYVRAIKRFLATFKKYEAGTATAYDVELQRLQVSDLMHDIDEKTRDYILVSDLGKEVPPPEVWLEWETDIIRVGGWREIIPWEKGVEKPTAGMDGWCDERTNICRIELRVDWVDWGAVRMELALANEHFWRQKQEKEIQDKLQVIVDSKVTYSQKDQAISAEIVDIISEIKSDAGARKKLGIEEFQYQILIKRDMINDRLDQAEDKGIIGVAIAEAEGWHEYDRWNDIIRGVIIYSDGEIEVAVRFHGLFTPYFLQAADYHVTVDVVWKVWTQELADMIDAAFSRYELEQSKIRLENLIAKRDELVALAKGLEHKVREYETGKISSGELKRLVHGTYFKLEWYDSEIAYLAAVSGQPYPEFDKIDIEIKTEHVNLKLWERDFEYRFGGGLGIQPVRFGPREERHKIRFESPEVKAKMKIKRLREGVEITEEGELVATGERATPAEIMRIPEKPMPPPAPAEVIEEVEVEIMHPEIAEEIKVEKSALIKEREERIGQMIEEEGKIFVDRKFVERKKAFGGKKLRIEGIKPKLRLQVDLTEAEIKKLAEELKARWQEAKEAEVIDDLIYNINLGLDHFPAMQQALREWGDTTTSLKLAYKNEPIIEFSFRIEDGNIVWIDYKIAEGAGTNSNNMYFEADFEALMRLRNRWEGRLKNAEGLGVLAAVPTFGSHLVGMLINGDIKIKPLSAVFKIPRFLQVFFGAGAMAHTTGVAI